MSADKRLIDTKGIMEEYNVKRAGAEALMRQLPKVEIPGFRKLYVKRRDLERFLEENTRAA